MSIFFIVAKMKSFKLLSYGKEVYGITNEMLVFACLLQSFPMHASFVFYPIFLIIIII